MVAGIDEALLGQAALVSEPSDFDVLGFRESHTVQERSLRMVPSAMIRRLSFPIVLIASLLSASAVVSQQEGAQWDLGRLEPGKAYPTTVTAANASCRGKHDFKITVEGDAARFISITGPDTLTRIGRGESKETAALVDLREAPPGSYEGTVRVRCTTCPANCTEDFRDLHVQFVVNGPGGSAPALASSGGGDSTRTRVRNPCPDDLSPCDELLRKAQELESAASAAESLAIRAAADQEWNNEQAEALEDFASQSSEYTRKRREQAEAWRQLARDADEMARVNDQRAQQYPAGHPWRESWEREAAIDRATAEERRRRADEIDKDADQTDGRRKEDTDRAEELRRRAEMAREDAVNKRQLAEDAWAAYDACLQQVRERCENQRKEAERQAAAALESSRRAQREAAAQAEADLKAMEDARAAAIARIGSDLFGYEPVPARTSTVCKTLVYEVPRGTLISNVRVRRGRLADDPTAIEIKLEESESTALGKTFTYHCLHEGSAIVTFDMADGPTMKRYRMRILCAADN